MLKAHRTSYNLAFKLKIVAKAEAVEITLKWHQRHHSVSLRTKTILAQRLPEDLEQQTVKFRRFVITSRQRRGYSLSRIFNMDETPMRFELPSSRTLEFELKINVLKVVFLYFSLAYK